MRSLTPEQQSHTLIVAQRFGGTFISEIAKVGIFSSYHNKRRILEAFPEIISKYGPQSDYYYKESEGRKPVFKRPEGGMSAMELVKFLPNLSKSSLYKLMRAWNIKPKRGPHPSSIKRNRFVAWLTDNDVKRLTEFAQRVTNGETTIKQLVTEGERLHSQQKQCIQD